MYIEEGDTVPFENNEDLSFFDDGMATVRLYVKKQYQGFIDVWRDSGKEYIILNGNAIYLDTIRKIEA